MATALLVLSVMPLTAAAQETPNESAAAKTHVGIETDFASRYVWRGIPLSNGPVWQPSAWVSAAGTTFTVWTNSNLGGTDRPGLNEVDLSLAHEHELRGTSLEGALILYTFPNQADAQATSEVTFKASRPVGRHVSLYTSHAVDVWHCSGSYWGDAGFSLEQGISPLASLEARAGLAWGSAGFHRAYLGVSRAAIDAASVDVSARIGVGGPIYVRPHATIAYVLDGGLRTSTGRGMVSAIGVAVGGEF